MLHQLHRRFWLAPPTRQPVPRAPRLPARVGFGPRTGPPEGFEGVARYAAKQAWLVETSTGWSGRPSTHSVDRPPGPHIKLDRTTRAAASRPHPNGMRGVASEQVRVGTVMTRMAIRASGYVLEELIAQCEGRARVTATIHSPLLCGHCIWRDAVSIHECCIWRDAVVTTLRFNTSLGATNGSISSMSPIQVLGSMSHSSGVSYPQVMQQLSQESSDKVHDSKGTVILTMGLNRGDLTAMPVGFNEIVRAGTNWLRNTNK